jgi:hypothetical protein
MRKDPKGRMVNEDRRAADRWMRDNVTERLSSIETAQKIYHDEMKSIMEAQYKEVSSLKDDVKHLDRVIFGGEAPGILENIRGIMWKFGIASTVGFGTVIFVLKLFSPALGKVANRIVGEDNINQMKYSHSQKKLKFFNQKTQEWEYYIELKPMPEKP